MKRRFRLFGSIRLGGRDDFDRASPQEALAGAQKEWLESPDDRIRAEVDARFARGEMSQEQHEKIMSLLNDPSAREDVETSTTSRFGVTSVRRVSVRTSQDKPAEDTPTQG